MTCIIIPLHHIFLIVPTLPPLSHYTHTQVDLEGEEAKDVGQFDPIETHVFDFPPHQAPLQLMRAQCGVCLCVCVRVCVCSWVYVCMCTCVCVCVCVCVFWWVWMWLSCVCVCMCVCVGVQLVRAQCGA